MAEDTSRSPETRDPASLVESIGQLLQDNDVIRAHIQKDEKTVELLLEGQAHAADLAREPGTRPAAADVHNDVNGALQEASERLGALHHLSTPDK